MGRPQNANAYARFHLNDNRGILDKHIRIKRLEGNGEKRKSVKARIRAKNLLGGMACHQ